MTGLLRCITKPFYSSVSLCRCIVTARVEHRHALLHGISINIGVRIIPADCDGVSACASMCVRGRIHAVGGRPRRRVRSCTTAERPCFTGSLAPGELEKIRECNDRFIITESCVQHYSAPTVCRRQSSCNFCWSGPPLNGGRICGNEHAHAHAQRRAWFSNFLWHSCRWA